MLQFENYLTIDVPKCHRETAHFFDKKLSKSSEFYYLEPGLYPSITDIVETMNTLIQEKHNHNESCFKIKVSKRMQKDRIHLADERSGLAFLSTDLRHSFGSNVGNKFGC